MTNGKIPASYPCLFSDDEIEKVTEEINAVNAFNREEDEKLVAELANEMVNAIEARHGQPLDVSKRANCVTRLSIDLITLLRCARIDVMHGSTTAEISYLDGLAELEQPEDVLDMGTAREAWRAMCEEESQAQSCVEEAAKEKVTGG